MAVVSVIVPCFNQGKYLAAALDSVLAQTFTNWECIVINDGSIDNTEEVAQAYPEKDERFKYIYQTNQGVCAARNRAIGEAKGEYILCLDGDDKISSDFLQESVPLLANNPDVKVATSRVELFGGKQGPYELPEYSLPLLLARNLFVITSLFRKADFDRVGGFNENMKNGLEDWDFWIAVLKNGGNVVRLDGIVFYYRMHGHSRNRSISHERNKELRYQIWKNHEDVYSRTFVDPTETFEYRLVRYSREYRLGQLLLHPIRFFKNRGK